MGAESKIEWTDATWNCIRGCSRVSKGCEHCYAEREAWRHAGPGDSYEGLVQITNAHPQWTGEVRFIEEHLRDPLKWKKPRRIFVNSMSDLFHERLPLPDLCQIFAIMAIAEQHQFQILTKRPERMGRYLSEPSFWEEVAAWVEQLSYEISPCLGHRVEEIKSGEALPLPNVWLGVSVESPKHKDRIDILRETPAAVRMLSLEPLLEDLGQLDLRGIGWTIVGGESGPGARPMHPAWPRSIRDQCQAAGVPFFFKQWGEWLPVATPRLGVKVGERMLIQPDGSTRLATWADVMQTTGEIWAVERLGKKRAGRLLDLKEWNEFPTSYTDEEQRAGDGAPSPARS